MDHEIGGSFINYYTIPHNINQALFTVKAPRKNSDQKEFQTSLEPNLEVLLCYSEDLVVTSIV